MIVLLQISHQRQATHHQDLTENGPMSMIALLQVRSHQANKILRQLCGGH